MHPAKKDYCCNQLPCYYLKSILVFLPKYIVISIAHQVWQEYQVVGPIDDGALSGEIQKKSLFSHGPCPAEYHLTNMRLAPCKKNPLKLSFVIRPGILWNMEPTKWLYCW